MPWRRLDVLARTLPFVQARFPTRAAYGQASVAEILGERFAGASLLEAAWLESTVFLNRGTNFIARPLPLLAQAAPAFGVAVGDCDGDGREDIFLAQNFFAVQVEMPRLDAGVGLWLRGDGHGGFTPLRPDESGVRIYGEQRGAALADYDLILVIFPLFLVFVFFHFFFFIFLLVYKSELTFFIYFSIDQK